MDARALVALNLRLHRNAAGLSQEDLADKATVDRTYVSGVERGIRNPTVTILQRFADALGIEVAALLAKPAPPPKKQRSNTAG